MPYRIKYGDSASHMWANVTTIKSGSFKNNEYLSDMTIPNTIDVIPSKCFSNCINTQEWRNWHTLRSQKPVEFSVRVQVPSPALNTRWFLPKGKDRRFLFAF